MSDVMETVQSELSAENNVSYMEVMGLLKQGLWYVERPKFAEDSPFFHLTEKLTFSDLLFIIDYNRDMLAANLIDRYIGVNKSIAGHILRKMVYNLSCEVSLVIPPEVLSRTPYTEKQRKELRVQHLKESWASRKESWASGALPRKEVSLPKNADKRADYLKKLGENAQKALEKLKKAEELNRLVDKPSEDEGSQMLVDESSEDEGSQMLVDESSEVEDVQEQRRRKKYKKNHEPL